ncbi:MAG: RnfABCDGE type electron transport complex subunit D [Gammaproteobacteria bacterium]
MTEKPALSSPHIHTGSSVSAIMLRVCLALLPGLLCYIWFFGWGVLLQCIIAVLFALLIEAIMLKFRGRAIRIFITDGSVIVTALLFALSITPLTSWWISLLGIAFAVIFAKHLFGGLGHNLFNPAMAGYVFVFLCFPAAMTVWPAAPGTTAAQPDITTYIQCIFAACPAAMDGVTGATPLAHMQSQLTAMNMISEIRESPIYSGIGGKGWEWINLAFLLGGTGLVFLRIIHWQIPVAMLAGLFLTAGLFNIHDGELYASPLFYLFSGGTMLAAFFIATDPVTASGTPRGRIIYAGLIGVLVYLIRTFGAFPDGIAFAVLIANAFVPAIDHFTRPRVLGENQV